jgi:hypothetical protein
MYTIVKSNAKSFFVPCASSECAQFAALHTSDDILLCAKHFAIKADQFLQLLFVFDPSSVSGL